MLLDEYTLNQFLGKGTFGEVYLTTKKNSNFLFATKRMSKDFVEDPKYIKYFNNEISILNKLFHKNIVKLEALKKTKNHYYVIMEYCNGGTLTECLEKYKNLYHRPFTEEIVQHIMRQVVSAVNYMHDLRIIHRDLKLDNILVKFENEEDKNNFNLLKGKIKIIDFCFAKNNLSKTVLETSKNMNLKIENKEKNNHTFDYDFKVDIWSLGIICYQMLIGKHPFDGGINKELDDSINKSEYTIPNNLTLSKEAISFINSMLEFNPEKRLNIDDLVNHCFLINKIGYFSFIDLKRIKNDINKSRNILFNNKDSIWNIFQESKTLSQINSYYNNEGNMDDLSKSNITINNNNSHYILKKFNW